MILPQNYGLVLLLMALCLFCWGSWANTFKLAGKVRFEVYYMDFAIGCMVMALLYAFTVGNLGYDGFSFMDDLEHAGKRQWFYGFLAGVIFNLGNMLLMASVSVAGLAIAFPVGIGVSVIVGSILALISKPASNLLILFAGCALIAASIALGAIAYNILGVIRHEALARAGKAKSTRRPISVKGVILGAVGGLLLGSFFPLVQKGMESEIGLGPYAFTAVFSVGIVLSMLVFSIFFMNLPVEGDPVEFTQYFRSRPKEHLMGLLGGAIWCSGMVAFLVALTVPAAIRVSTTLSFLLSEGFPIVAALWGLLVWKEFRDGDARVNLSGVVMLMLLAGGLVLIAIAPLYVHKV
jgi:glucose uptake protein